MKNGIFSWDSEFYNSHKGWFPGVIILDAIGLALVIFTNLENDTLELLARCIGIFLVVLIEYWGIAKNIRKRDDELHLFRAKKVFYENYFRIYNKPPNIHSISKDDEKSNNAKKPIENYSSRWAIGLVVFAIFKLICFFLNNTVFADDLPASIAFIFISVTVPLIHWFFISYLFWIEKAHDEVTKEINEHFIKLQSAKTDKNQNTNIENCKRSRLLSFDTADLKPAYVVCANMFHEHSQRFRNHTGILTDDKGVEIINNISAWADRDLHVPQSLSSEFLTTQILKFKLYVAEESADTITGHYDPGSDSIKISETYHDNT